MVLRTTALAEMPIYVISETVNGNDVMEITVRQFE